MTLAPDLVNFITCPKCAGPLEYRTTPSECLVCQACRLVYAVEDDIPVLLVDEATPL